MLSTSLQTYHLPSPRHHLPLPRFPPSVYPQNHIAAGDVLARLQHEVRMLKDRESLLKLEIHHRQASLQDLQSSLILAINKANEIQNLLAPVSRLPNEVLLLIFEEAVSSQDGGKPAQRPERVVAMVSRRWRDVAIHSPRLWSRIWIIPGFTPDVLDMYKTRASSRTLDIEIRDWRERKTCHGFNTALETMLQASSRWRSLSVSHMCDSYLADLFAKLSQCRPLMLKHYSFRAQRPGQTCTIPFHKFNDGSAPYLESLDAENFSLFGDLNSIRSRAIQSFSRLTSLTLRRYSNDARSLRVMIDSNAFHAMISSIPNLTSLALHGQPVRFRNDSSLLDPSADVPPPPLPPISLPNLHTLILHPGVLKPRYLHKTLSLLSAPTLRHFELVFPDSKLSGQNIVDLLFDPSTKRPRFASVDTLVLHNAASAASTARAFVLAFPCVARVSLGGGDGGVFPGVLRAGAGTGSSGCVCDACARTYAHAPPPPPPPPRHASWPHLHTLTLRSIRADTLRVVRDWIRDEWEQRVGGYDGVFPPALVVVRARGVELGEFCRAVGMYTRVDVVGGGGGEGDACHGLVLTPRRLGEVEERGREYLDMV